MADPAKALSLNVLGDFFVDATCIDCDTCRQLAPEVFHEAGNYSVVSQQPSNDLVRRRTLHALLSCPTGSIGSRVKEDVNSAKSDFPLPIEGGLYYCGFTSEDSYGASSYFLQHPDGNWLIDSPKYLPFLADRFEALGGVRYIFLSHRDDVADADRYQALFAAERIIHRAELSAQPGAERVIEGKAVKHIGDDFLIIPTPGHTRGSMSLLFQNRYLFTGDHMWWSRNRKGLTASRSVCWYDWPTQVESVKRLLGYEFEWVLPGHGERIHFEKREMHAQMERLIARIA